MNMFKTANNYKQNKNQIDLHYLNTGKVIIILILNYLAGKITIFGGNIFKLFWEIDIKLVDGNNLSKMTVFFLSLYSIQYKISYKFFV